MTVWAICFILWTKDGQSQTYCPPSPTVLYATQAACKSDLLAAKLEGAGLPELPKDAGVLCARVDTSPSSQPRAPGPAKKQPANPKPDSDSPF